MSARVALSDFSKTYLDFLRFASAAVVVLGHVNGLFFIDHPSYTLFSKLFYSLGARSHDAVLVFFVLSGFFITQSASKTFIQGTETWKHYAIARLSRLYVVLVPALLLGLLWDQIGGHYFGASYGEGTTWVAENNGWQNFFGNLLFLQKIFIEPFGSNLPLWSLAYEGWCYVLLPLLVMVVTRVGKSRWVYGAVVLMLLGMFGGDFRGYFLIWLLGAALFFLPTVPRFSVRVQWAMLLLSFFLVIVTIFVCRKILFLSNPVGFFPDVIVGLAILVHVGCVVSSQMPIARKAQQWASKLAGFSFSLYVLHYPLVLLLSFALLAGQRWKPDGVHMFAGMGVVMLMMLYAYSISRLTEARTSNVRQWLTQRMMAWGWL